MFVSLVWNLIRFWCFSLSIDKYSESVSISTYFVTSRPGYLTFDLENQYDSALTQDSCMCQIWWCCAKAFVSYAWSSIRTDRHTDSQTNILAKMKILARNINMTNTGRFVQRFSPKPTAHKKVYEHQHQREICSNDQIQRTISWERNIVGCWNFERVCIIWSFKRPSHGTK